jgi:2,3-bisphosphoglycerate-dependent phosphoglycerate mutase
MTTLLLARHGETDWNRELRIQGSSDIALNERGREQASALAQELADVPLDAIYSSDLSRARETADAVAATHELEIQLDPRLRERSFGSWEGLTREDIAQLPDGSRHDGESDDEVRERVLEAVQAIADAHPGEQVLVVAHGGALNALWHHAVGERVERWANCAVYRLAVREGEFLPVD